MPRIPFFRLGGAPDRPAPPRLAASTPSVSLEGISIGVDNLRHDVVLSSRCVELGRAYIARSIVRHGELEGLLSAEVPRATQGPAWMRNQAGGGTLPKKDAGGGKTAAAGVGGGGPQWGKEE